jgi:ubiquinone/menaquinone biosynthesis C-methylase UbiE
VAAGSKANELAQARSGYDRWAPVYDLDGNPLQALEQPCVRGLLDTVRDRRALDLGCGTGRHALWLAGQGARVTAVDFSQGMLDQARLKQGAHAVTWLVHDLHQPLPFDDHAFDTAVSGLVLEHIRDLNLFFQQAGRVLTTGGNLVVSAMHPAMMLRGTQARFTDPQSGDVVSPGSLPHQISDFLTAALSANLHLEHISEHRPDQAFATQYPRAKKYLGWPMLVVMRFKA